MHLHEGCSPLVVVHLKHGQGKNFGNFGHLKAMFGVCFLGVIGGGKIILAIYL